MRRDDVEFASEGTTCRAWHYRPEGDEARPCIVMAHGFGVTRDCTIPTYAERFVDEGFNVLLFDYRHFGTSDGKPRLLLSVGKQLDDWQAAIDGARKLPGVDRDRIGLWGTSFSGGHVIVAAARDGQVAAVSSQGAMMDGRAAFLDGVRQAGPLNGLRLTAMAVADTLFGLAGGAIRVTVAGEPGSLALLTTPDVLEGYRSITTPDWPNEVCARVALQTVFHRPVTWADKLPCPLLLFVCEDDSVAPASAVLEVAERAAGPVELHRYPIAHFDIYHGEIFEEAVGKQVTFFKQHLLGETG